MLCQALKSHNDGGEFDQGEFDDLVAYSMACTIENDDECELKYGLIRFGPLDKMIEVENLVSLMFAKESQRRLARPVEHKGSIEQCSRRSPERSGVALNLVERATTSKNASFLFCSRFVMGFWGFFLRLSNMLWDYKRGS